MTTNQEDFTTDYLRAWDESEHHLTDFKAALRQQYAAGFTNGWLATKITIARWLASRGELDLALEVCDLPELKTQETTQS